MEETGVPGENHRSTCPKSLTNFSKYCCIQYISPWTGIGLTTLVLIDTECIGICKYNYRTITTTRVPLKLGKKKQLNICKKVMRSRQSKDRQCNDQKKKDTRRNNILQKTTHETKDWTTRTHWRLTDELRCFRIVSSSCITSGIHEYTIPFGIFISCRYN